MASAPLLLEHSETEDFTPEEIAMLRKIRELVDSKYESETTGAPVEPNR
ncbi:MAG: hypothetical protein ABSH32_12635 [Bryobacteraceae bacterium]|jgi:hypothetical protein